MCYSMYTYDMRVCKMTARSSCPTTLKQWKAPTLSWVRPGSKFEPPVLSLIWKKKLVGKASDKLDKTKTAVNDSIIHLVHKETWTPPTSMRQPHPYCILENVRSTITKILSKYYNNS